MWLATLGAFDAGDPGFGWIALSYLVTGGVLAGWLLLAGRRGWNPWWALAPAIGLALATLLRVAVTSGIDADESEHLHLAFAIGHDLMPYRDLDQNHTPLLWLLLAPLLALLPESPYVLWGFRLLCLASFAGSVALACGISRQLWRGGDYQTPFCVFLGLVFATQAECYRLRPDAFMNTLALASLYVLVGHTANRRPRSALLAGALQGLAIAFSPKVAHLALLAPCLLWLAQPRGRPAQRLRGWLAGALLYAAGSAAMLAPVGLWLAWNGLLEAAYDGIVAHNFGYTSRRLAASAPVEPSFYNSVLEPDRLAEMAIFFVVTLCGAAMLARSATPPGSARRAIRLCAVAAWLLWMSLWTFTPNAATYHIAGALLLAAALGAPALDRAARRWRSAAGPWALAALLALCLGTAPLRAGVGGFVLGYSYPLSDVAWLLNEVRQRGGACLCIVPWHPIFVSSVAPVYRSNELRSGRWPAAIEWALVNRPAAVMAPRFSGLVQRRVITAEERSRMMEFLNAHYELVPAGTAGFWLLREDR